MPHGYAGKILKVDLSTGQISVDEHDEVWYRTYMGGAAVGAYYLLNEMPPKADPYGPDNLLGLLGLKTPYRGSISDFSLPIMDPEVDGLS